MTRRTIIWAAAIVFLFAAPAAAYLAGLSIAEPRVVNEASRDRVDRVTQSQQADSTRDSRARGSASSPSLPARAAVKTKTAIAPTVSDQPAINVPEAFPVPTGGTPVSGSADTAPPAAQPASAKTVTILLIHGGGWNKGSYKDMLPLAALYRHKGYNAVSVEYLDGNYNILHQLEVVAAEVDRYRAQGPVVCYGISAGGTIASALAATGTCDGAVNVIGPTDLVKISTSIPYYFSARHWSELGMSEVDRFNASPVHRLGGRVSPQLLMYGAADRLVVPAQNQEYAQIAKQRQPDTHWVVMPGTGHSHPMKSAVLAALWVYQRWPASQR